MSGSVLLLKRICRSFAFFPLHKTLLLFFLAMILFQYPQLGPGAQEDKICVNVLGYSPSSEKLAILMMTSSRDDLNFTIKDKNERSVFRGKALYWGQLWGYYCYFADFSKFNSKGEFHVVYDKASSVLFKIKDGILDEINEEKIFQGHYASQSCDSKCSQAMQDKSSRHEEDVAIFSSVVDGNGIEKILGRISGDVSGGSHTSSAYDKDSYLLSYETFILSLISPHLEKSALAECKKVIARNVEYLLKVQDKRGGFAWGVASENETLSRRLVCNVSMDGTQMVVMALIRAQSLLPHDFLQGRMDNAILRARGWLEENLRRGMVEGEKAVEKVSQRKMIGVFIELYFASQEEKYLNEVIRLLNDIGVDDLETADSHLNPMILELCRITPHLKKYEQDKARDLCHQWVSQQREFLHQTPFSVNVQYFDGKENSNLFLLHHALNLLLIAKMSEDREIFRLGVEELQWVLGRNPFGISFVTGVGQSFLPQDEILSFGSIVAGPSGGFENLALGREAAASSEDSCGEFPASKAVDGLMDTRWGSPFSEPHFLEVNLGSVREISHVVLRWEPAYAKEYRLEVSQDRNEWKTVWTQKRGRGGREDVSFEPCSAQYVRLFCEKRATGWGFSLYELEVYGGQGPSFDLTDSGHVRSLKVYSLSTALLLFSKSMMLSKISWRSYGVYVGGGIAGFVGLFFLSFLILKKRHKSFRLEKNVMLTKLPSQTYDSQEVYHWEELIRKSEDLRREAGLDPSLSYFVGCSAPFLKLLDQVRKVSAQDSTVLITGDVGVGKGLVVRTLHGLSKRSRGPLIELNCAAIPEALFESELFGIEKGIATGVEARAGKFEHARGGILFLDEIGDMSLSNQAKLLKVIQEKKVTRVGSHRTIDLDVRIIAATNQNLSQLIEGNKFRQDLFSRLNVLHIHVPSLRDRAQDIPLLIHAFLERKGRQDIQFSVEAMKTLAQYPWSHHVRELENEVERLVSFSRAGKLVMSEDLTPGIMKYGGSPETLALAKLLSPGDMQFLNRLRFFQFNISKAAEDMGKNRDTVNQNFKGICFVALDVCQADLVQASALVSGDKAYQNKVEDKVREYLENLQSLMKQYGKKKTDLVIEAYRKVPQRFIPALENLIEWFLN